ncbi:hypothetical protein HPB52_013972 [Rhipicephalus sanguineus]|uniref:Uncharacterized protein n=1 Tax=Rhipicephalus sanguineus TaxID=34632 RepID=A0A9D4PDW8_RHISA|nr:hypothetical protein HPB52_013972 [Rhipicephalus sanguineus]
MASMDVVFEDIVHPWYKLGASCVRLATAHIEGSKVATSHWRVALVIPGVISVAILEGVQSSDGRPVCTYTPMLRSLYYQRPILRTRSWENTRLRRGDSVDKTRQFESTKQRHIVPVVKMPQCGNARPRRGNNAVRTLQFERRKRLRIELGVTMLQCENMKPTQDDSGACLK